MKSVKGVYSRNADVKIALKKGEPRVLRQPKPPQEGRDDALEVYNEIKEAMIHCFFNILRCIKTL